MAAKWTLTPLAQEHCARNGFTRADMLGFLDGMISEAKPDDMVTQFDRHYQHGGGWRDSANTARFTIDTDPVAPTLTFPEDPPMRGIATITLREERGFLFEGSWVAVVQPNGALRVARMD